MMYEPKLESMPRRELEVVQLSRLKHIVDYAYGQVPLFKQRLDKAGIDPGRIKSLADLKHLPFTSKVDLRNNYPFGLFAVSLADIRRLHASSGTKGKSTIVGYTQKDLNTWAQVCARSLIAAGVKPKDILHNSYGYGLFTGGLGIHQGAELLGTTVIPASGGQTQQQIILLTDLKARILCSTPSYALNLAFTLDEMQVPRSTLALEIGVFGAEPWSEPMRQQLEKRLQIKALDIYGLSEIIGPGVAMECIEGRCGLHIWEDHFLPEIIDPHSGEPLEPGQEGELVFTNLTKESLPLLRYRTGDLSSLNYEPCVCGRTMVRMSRVKTRLDDMLIIRGVNLYPSEIERVLLGIEELSPNYQLVVSREKALDTLTVQVEVTDEIIARWGEFADGDVRFSHLSSRIIEEIKGTLGLTARVKLLPPGSITHGQGKAIRVIDQRRQALNSK